MKQLKEICLCHCSGLDFPNTRTVFQSVVWIAVSFLLTARFSCIVTFAHSRHLEAKLLLEVPWHRFQNSLCVLSPPVFNGISFVFLEQLAIPQGFTFIKAVSTQFLMPTINPSHAHSAMPNPVVSALISSQMLCLDALSSISFFSGAQSRSPSWLQGDLRARAEEQASAAASLSLKFRFLATVCCSTTKINCFRTNTGGTRCCQKGTTSWSPENWLFLHHSAWFSRQKGFTGKHWFYRLFSFSFSLKINT